MSQAVSNPAKRAVIFGDDFDTYKELNSKVDHVARKLNQLGVEPGMQVGLYMHSSPEMIIALLAILSAGGAFVPLDPSFPVDRLKFIAFDLNSLPILTTEDLSDHAPGDPSTRVCVERLLVAGSEVDRELSNLVSFSSVADAACVLYTSGSSGRPKGVVREHRSIVARLDWIPYQPDDVYCHNMSLCHGFSQERLFLPLMMGLPLVVLPDEAHRDARKFSAAMEKYGVTTVTLAPTFLQQLLDLEDSQISKLKSLRTVAVGSAPLQAELVRKFKTLLPDTQLINAYGGTEAGSVARGEVTNADAPITIGKPVANAEIYILDEYLVPVPDGDVGELCVGGPSIARGYWQQPELTAQKFIQHPFSRVEGAKIYRTGDRGRYLADGRIELVGRADRQVKVRGYRVELGEVESILIQHPDIKEATVLSQPIVSDHRLIAYICPKDGRELTVTFVREYLKERVPDYMLPSSYAFLAELPRTSIGKVDASALPSPGIGRPHLDNPYVSPRTPREDMIAAIWAEILEINTVGVHDHFLDLGGESLLAIRIMAAITDRMGLELRAEVLFDRPTVAELAAAFDIEGIDASV